MILKNYTGMYFINKINNSRYGNYLPQTKCECLKCAPKMSENQI